MPCGSRAAYSVSSFIQTKQNAPRSCGSTSSARCSSERVGVVGEQRGDQAGVVGRRLDVAGLQVELAVGAGQVGDHLRRSSWVLIRLPLWPSAMEPSAVGRNVGCAFCQVLAPVVE